MKINKLLEEFKMELKTLYGKRLKYIILYGSWARGDATDESDVDLAIILEGEVVPFEEIDRLTEITCDIDLKYEVLISLYPISEHNYFHFNTPFLINLREEGISI